MGFLAALQLLTVLPVRRSPSPEDLRASVAYFPVVGVVIGLVLAGLGWLLPWVLPRGLVNALLVVALVVMTGALHLDGLSDTCDGLGGHRTVEERWRVMHDSHAGAFGVVGIVLALLLEYTAIGAVPARILLPTLALVPVASRWAMVYAMFVHPYARPEGMGKLFKEGATAGRFVMATAVAVGVAWVLAGAAGLAIMGTVWLVTAGAAFGLKKQFAGLTGDTYGALNELAEVTVLVTVSLLVRLGLAGLD